MIANGVTTTFRTRERNQEQKLRDQEKSIEQIYEEVVDVKKIREHCEMKQNEISLSASETIHNLIGV